MIIKEIILEYFIWKEIYKSMECKLLEIWMKENELRNLWLNYVRYVFDIYDDFFVWLNRYNYIFGGEKFINMDIEFIK